VNECIDHSPLTILLINYSFSGIFSIITEA
jgi:hypothetical protein